MSDDRLSKIEKVFLECLDLSPDERASYLERACGDDAELRREVESLVTADGQAGEFLERPVVEHGISRHEARGHFTSGDRIGPYKVLRKAGEGGMSEVYLAVRADDEYQKRVALKIIRHGADREDLLRRFRTERQILAGLDHPNIAKLLDGGTTDDGLPYFVMDFIEGVPIDLYCDEHRLSVRERLTLFRTVCSAVQSAHQNLVVHRDIKAGNILVTSDGVPKLLDFGIAKLIKPDQFAQQVEYTENWMRPMTPRYASPEQIQGRPVTTASDVYSLGVLLYKLLTGHLPHRFEGLPPGELSRIVVETDPERPSTAVDRAGETEPDSKTLTAETVSKARGAQPQQLRRQLSGDLDNIALVALRKEPQRRYASVEQFSEDIRRYLDGLPVMARKDTFSYRSAKFLRRNRWAVAVGAAFVVMLVAFSIVMAVQASRVARQRDEAWRERDRAEQVVALLEGVFAVSDPLHSGEDISALEVIERGAEQVERDLRDQPEVQAELMTVLGNVYGNLGLHDRADRLLRQSIDQRRETLGERHVDVAESLSSLGVSLVLQGRFDEAEPLLVEASEIREEAWGRNHPAVAESRYSLARLRQGMGDYEESEQMFREALEVQEATAGEGRMLAAMQGDLAVLLAEMAKFDDAEILFRQSLELRRRLLGDDHVLVAESMNDLGVLLGMQGQLEESESLFRETLAVRRKVLGDDHPQIAESLNNLGRVLKEKGEYDEAERQYREGLRVERHRLGDDHPRVAILTANLAGLLQQKGEYDEAERLARTALDARRRVLGPGHTQIGYSLVGVGSIVLDDGRPAEAEVLLTEGLGIYVDSLPAEHWRISQTRSLLGEAAAKLGRDAEAEPLLLEGYEGLLATRGPEHRRTRAARERLAGFYTARGRDEEARKYLVSE